MVEVDQQVVRVDLNGFRIYRVDDSGKVPRDDAGAEGSRIRRITVENKIFQSYKYILEQNFTF